MFRLLVASTRRSVGVVTAAGVAVAVTSYSTTKAEEAPSTTSNKDDAADEPMFHGQCLERQLHKPKVPYPAWDDTWDDESRNKNKTRHILLIRHGQYDESSKDDALRILTPLGRRQADLTGQRLALLARGGVVQRDSSPETKIPQPCSITSIHSSDMTRAKETAAIIAGWFPEQSLLQPPDALLNEALPSPMIPPRPDIIRTIPEVDDNHDRVEEAFQKYIVGQRRLTKEGEEETGDDDSFQVVVCHGNVIRYFFCRALQLPPEAWLRMSTYNCSITYLVLHPSGHVSARLMGDTGHIPYEDTTFSERYGYVG